MEAGNQHEKALAITSVTVIEADNQDSWLTAFEQRAIDDLAVNLVCDQLANSGLSGPELDEQLEAQADAVLELLRCSPGQLLRYLASPIQSITQMPRAADPFFGYPLFDAKTARARLRGASAEALTPRLQ
jgi:hypothetical protein